MTVEEEEMATGTSQSITQHSHSHSNHGDGIGRNFPPQFAFFTNPVRPCLSIFNTTPEFRSANSASARDPGLLYEKSGWPILRNCFVSGHVPKRAQ